MNELLVNKLRTARLNKNMKQQDVANILGIKPNTLSNWEKGRTEPDIDTFVKLCDIYEIDCAALLSEAYVRARIKSEISMEEYNILKKYRQLDDRGRELVDSIIEQAYNSRPVITGQYTLFTEEEILESKRSHFADINEPDIMQALFKSASEKK